jgi:deazaflavin-dependent oxidoreductase (nitroreductase family)
VGLINVDAFASRLNPLVIAILRAPLLHWLLSPGLMLLTVRGRRSGRRYTIPVGYQRDGALLIVLVSEARKKQWWRNYREAQPAEIRLRGRAHTAVAVVIASDSEEFASRLERSLQRMPSMARVFGVTGYDKRTGLTTDQHSFLAKQIAIVRIETTRF